MSEDNESIESLNKKLTRTVRRKGMKHIVFSYCITCKFFVSKELQCRAYPEVYKDKPTTDTDRAYKYNFCGDRVEKGQR